MQGVFRLRLPPSAWVKKLAMRNLRSLAVEPLSRTNGAPKQSAHRRRLRLTKIPAASQKKKTDCRGGDVVLPHGAVGVRVAAPHSAVHGNGPPRGGR